MGLGPRLERRLDAQLAERPSSARAWLSVWGTLVLLGFSYRLALATRLVLGALTAFAFARGHDVVGALLAVIFAAYVLQLPLLVDVARREEPRSPG